MVTSNTVTFCSCVVLRQEILIIHLLNVLRREVLVLPVGEPNRLEQRTLILPAEEVIIVLVHLFVVVYRHLRV